jgi:hypothetical protein
MLVDDESENMVNAASPGYYASCVQMLKPPYSTPNQIPYDVKKIGNKIVNLRRCARCARRI